MFFFQFSWINFSSNYHSCSYLKFLYVPINPFLNLLQDLELISSLGSGDLTQTETFKMEKISQNMLHFGVFHQKIDHFTNTQRANK